MAGHRRAMLFSAGVLAAVLGFGIAASAQDPLELAPDNYKKLFENDKVRVLELRIKPGESLPMHEHPDHYVYVITGGTLKLTHPDGSVAEITAEEGQVLWIPAESHATVNTGTTEVRAIVNELKLMGLARVQGS